MRSHLAALHETYAAAAAEVRAEQDAERAYHRASELRASLDVLVSSAATLRGETAYALARRDGLSVAQLGERLAVSKARAYQLLQIGLSAHESRLPGEHEDE